MRSNNLLSIQLVVAFLSAFVIIYFFFPGDTKFDQFALGTDTVSYMATDAERTPVQLSIVNTEQAQPFLGGYERRGRKDVVFFFGNSQSHSINQKKPNEINFIQLLYDSFSNRGQEILCHSLPNGSLKEFYLSYSYWKESIHIKALVVPIFFDDLREDKVRNLYYPRLISEHFLIKDSTDGIAVKINQNLASFWLNNEVPLADSNPLSKRQPVVAVEPTVQEQVESVLDSALENNSQAWKNRQNVRGSFFVLLYQLRNTIFRINSGTIRQVIPQRYDDNMHALTRLMQDCVKDQVQLLLYIPPIRRDVRFPYDPSAYARFKKEVLALSKANEGTVYFRDFDTIVPGPLWGYKGATNFLERREPDYMHFKFEGHRILADSLSRYLKVIN